MKILVIGGDSYVGSSFIRNSTFNDCTEIISRRKTSIDNEVIIDDLTNIPDLLFKNIDTVVSFIGIAHRKEKGHQDLYYKVNRDLVLTIANKAKSN